MTDVTWNRCPRRATAIAQLAREFADVAVVPNVHEWFNWVAGSLVWSCRHCRVSTMDRYPGPTGGDCPGPLA